MARRCRGVPAAVFLLLVAASSSIAHHSVPGQFDTSKLVTLKGTISRVEWMNPHAYVYLDVKEANGAVRTWALGTLPIPMLRKAGLTKEALKGKPGEMVTITVMPAKDGTKRLAWISRITYSDGHHYRLFE
ncbi:MAG TPA: DUF6152 family protein [Vicinamibacterales bacterium]|jgi:hypothetical protein